MATSPKREISPNTTMADETKHSMVNTNFPVLLLDIAELRLSDDDFLAYVKDSLKPSECDKAVGTFALPIRTANDDESKDVRAAADVTSSTREPPVPTPPPQSEFMDGLIASGSTVPSFDERDGKMLTDNGDVAYSTSGSPLVDLFQEVTGSTPGIRLRVLLERAWKEDAGATLKLIWNSRSIHLGKSSRDAFYQAMGWLYETHPLTLLTNLPWLVRPIIEKKAPKSDATTTDAKSKTDEDDDFEIVDRLDGPPSPKKMKLDDPVAPFSEYDVKYGVAHGYWKDLLNLLALAANGELKVDGNPRAVLNIHKPKQQKPYKRDWTAGRKKNVITERHERAVKLLETDARYKALHLTVARLFAEQLKVDSARLEAKRDMKLISLAGKWAPSHKGMHDQHTCIVSTIAELLYRFDQVCPEADPGDRTLYLKHAREAYGIKTLSKLRKFLQIVERPTTANTFAEINYDRVPSLAMQRYTPLFAKKDFDRFDQYLDKVATGKARISGAVLLPSTLVHSVAQSPYRLQRTKASAAVDAKVAQLKAKATNGQWHSLVQRIRDSGTLSSAIAVCDVSGSMVSPQFPDGTCPLHSSVGLSLLIAEITAPPFGGAFITFDAVPQVMHVGGPDDTRTFEEKARYILSAPAGFNTDFVAVFEKSILPMAVERKLPAEEMVKRVFVFSDMHFDAAESGSGAWESSYERIQREFRAAGYEMPELVFWNLAGESVSTQDGEPSAAPKPVTAAERGTALVGGYSQGQLKMFLEGGQFDEAEGGEDVVEGDVVVVNGKKEAMTPEGMMWKAISHPAYRMLEVVD